MARGMLIFVSDIHLTDALKGPSVSRADMFERFWVRIAASRGDVPAHLCFVGDLFDIVRSPRWFDTDARPYAGDAEALAAITEDITAAILEREAGFFDAIRAQVQAGALEVSYVLGNHDRLLAQSPGARRRVYKALTGRDEDVDFPAYQRFDGHGVLAYHGHLGDPVCSEPEGAPPIGDAIGLELIVRYPQRVKAALGDDVPDGFDTSELEDIDDVRPVYAVPAWVRQLASRHPEVLKPMWESWGETVEEFLDIDFVRYWMKQRRTPFGFDLGRKLRLLLELSTGRIMAKTADKRLTAMYRFLQHGFDGKLVHTGVDRLASEEGQGLRYVVNGHSHFPSMVPLGLVDGNPGAYFNTGTWRTVHQIGHHLGGRPSFLPYDAMSYLCFFPERDKIGREYEWWTGAMVTRQHTEQVRAAVDPPALP